MNLVSGISVSLNSNNHREQTGFSHSHLVFGLCPKTPGSSFQAYLPQPSLFNRLNTSVETFQRHCSGRLDILAEFCTVPSTVRVANVALRHGWAITPLSGTAGCPVPCPFPCRAGQIITTVAWIWCGWLESPGCLRSQCLVMHKQWGG